MFDFLKRRSVQPSLESAKQRFDRLVTEMWNRPTEYTDFDALLHAMKTIENEMNRNGGCNWAHADYEEDLNTIKTHLSNDGELSRELAAEVNLSLEKISLCGQELIRKGSSGMNIEGAISFLIDRTVDWCEQHPRVSDEQA